MRGVRVGVGEVVGAGEEGGVARRGGVGGEGGVCVGCSFCRLLVLLVVGVVRSRSSCIY